MIRRTPLGQFKSYGASLSILIFSMLTMVVTGCATTATLTEPIQKTRTFEASYDEVWKAAVQALTSQNQMITMSQKDSGVIGVDREFNRDNVWAYILIDGWTKFWTTWQKFRSRANLVIQPTDETKTKVLVNVQIMADYLQSQPNFFLGTVTYSNQELQLVSNGKIEKEYLDMIEAQIPNVRKLAWLGASKNQAAVLASKSTAASAASSSATSTVNPNSSPKATVARRDQLEQIEWDLAKARELARSEKNIVSKKVEAVVKKSSQNEIIEAQKKYQERLATRADGIGPMSSS